MQQYSLISIVVQIYTSCMFMLSLYIHIPFCHHKCGYCSFNVIPLHSLNDEQEPATLITHYLEALHRQIDDMKDKL